MKLQETFDDDFMGGNTILNTDKKRNSIMVKDRRRSKKGPNILKIDEESSSSDSICSNDSIENITTIRK